MAEEESGAPAARPVALVAGARQGAGRAACIALAGLGYDIIGVDSAMEGARDTGFGVIATGARYDFRLADIARPEMVDALLHWAWAAREGVEAAVIPGPGGEALLAALVQRLLAAEAPRRGPRLLALAGGMALAGDLAAALETAAVPLLTLPAAGGEGALRACLAPVIGLPSPG